MCVLVSSYLTHPLRLVSVLVSTLGALRHFTPPLDAMIVDKVRSHSSLTLDDYVSGV